jgi:hypothetical protein
LRALRGQGWVEKEERGGDAGGGDAGDAAELDEDEDAEYLARADRFEADYNFRFQARARGGRRLGFLLARAWRPAATAWRAQSTL